MAEEKKESSRPKSVKEVLAKVKKSYATAVCSVEEAGTIPRVFINSPSLNFIFGGGFGMGRIYEFFGPESGGKSSIATYIAGELQKRSDRPMVVFVDFERSFDQKYAELLGLDTSEDKFIFLRPDTGEDGFEIIKTLIQDLPIGLVIWDSLATTPNHSMIVDMNKACVSPDTLVEILGEDEVPEEITMDDLFKRAGLDYLSMTTGVFYPPKKEIKIASLDEKFQKTYKNISHLVYKGKSTGYKVNPRSSLCEEFRCSPYHKFYDYTTQSYQTAEELYKTSYITYDTIDEITGRRIYEAGFLGINEEGKPVEVSLAPCGKEFPILDMQIPEGESYLSAGLLSHNTFGGTAAVFSNGLKAVNPLLSRTGTSMIVINQERDNIGAIGPMAPKTKTTGGQAIKFYSSWRARITRIEDIKEKGSVVGIVCKVRNVKNKIGIPKRESLLTLRFATGIDSEGEYVDFAVNLGLVKQGGAWFSQEEWGMKVQGKDKVFEFLKERPDLFEKVKKTVDAMMSGETILDTMEKENDDDEFEEYGASE